MALRTPKPDLRAILVANLIERKGILDFLQEVSKYSWKQGSSISLVGSSEIEPAYAQECLYLLQNDSSLSALVKYKGVLQREEVWQSLQESNLFISAATMETFGMAIQEAVASGLPLLVLKGGYVAEHFKMGAAGRSFGKLADLVAFLKKLEDDEELFLQFQGKAVSNQKAYYTWKDAASSLVDQLDF